MADRWVALDSNSSDTFSDLLVAHIVTVVSSASTPCFVVTTPVAMLHVAMPPERLGATCVYGAYVRPMLIHVRLLGAMLGPCWSHVELMLSQEQRVPFKPLPGPKARRLDHVGTMLGFLWGPC